MRSLSGLTLPLFIGIASAFAQSPEPYTVIEYADVQRDTEYFSVDVSPVVTVETPGDRFTRLSTIASGEGSTELPPTPPYIAREIIDAGPAAIDREIPNDDAWTMIQFGDFDLGERSQLVISSISTQQSQVFTHDKLTAWRAVSARLRGTQIQLDLVVSPGDTNVFYNIQNLLVGPSVSASGGRSEDASNPDLPESLCGVDDRTPSSDPRVGRIMPIGCTGFALNNGVLLSAGHCFSLDTLQSYGVDPDTLVLEFGVPKSLPSGKTVPTSPEHQFKIDYPAAQFADQGRGLDWAVFTVVPNDAGLMPDEVYGGFDFGPSAEPGDIRVRGYGGDYGVDNQTQQDATGELVTHNYASMQGAPGVIGHRADTRGGNSGSPVFFARSGRVFGIHTHAGCASPRGNGGTSFNQLDLWDAIADGSRGAITYQKRFVLNRLFFEGGNHEELRLDFGTPFAHIYRIDVEVRFGEDMFDTGESWYGPFVFGGQRNTGGSRDYTRLNHRGLQTGRRLMDGILVEHFRANGGSFFVTEIIFTVVADPTPIAE